MKKYDQLSERQKEELNHLLSERMLTKLQEGQLALSEVVQIIKEEYDAAVTVLKIQGAETFIEKYNEAGDNIPSNYIRPRIYAVVHEAYMSHRPIVFGGFTPPFSGELEILQLARKSGNPNFKRKLDSETVGKKARELIDKKGWKRYIFKNLRKNSVYSYALLKDVAQALEDEGYEASITSIRRHLEEVGFQMPLNCWYPLR